MTLDLRSSERRVGRRWGRAEVSITVVVGVGNCVDGRRWEVGDDEEGEVRDGGARGWSGDSVGGLVMAGRTEVMREAEEGKESFTREAMREDFPVDSSPQIHIRTSWGKRLVSAVDGILWSEQGSYQLP